MGQGGILAGQVPQPVTPWAEESAGGQTKDVEVAGETISSLWPATRPDGHRYPTTNLTVLALSLNPPIKI